jgi:hypothetical protein
MSFIKTVWKWIRIYVARLIGYFLSPLLLLAMPLYAIGKWLEKKENGKNRIRTNTVQSERNSDDTEQKP